VLVLGSTFPVMFVGWEGVGLCSYLLIGFYFKKKSAGDAGKKAFIVNRIGDFGFILGTLMIFGLFGTPGLPAGGRRRGPPKPIEHSMGMVTIATLLLFLGPRPASRRKIPLFTWLPDAMEGPTPGLGPDPRRDDGDGGRLHDRQETPSSSGMPPITLSVVAGIGHRHRAPWPAPSALVQNDIKRVPRVLDGVAARLHVPGDGGSAAFGAGIFHLYNPCLLQGAPLPRLPAP